MTKLISFEHLNGVYFIDGVEIFYVRLVGLIKARDSESNDHLHDYYSLSDGTSEGLLVRACKLNESYKLYRQRKFSESSSANQEIPSNASHYHIDSRQPLVEIVGTIRKHPETQQILICAEHIAFVDDWNQMTHHFLGINKHLCKYHVLFSTNKMQK